MSRYAQVALHVNQKQYLTNARQVNQLKQAQEDEHNDARVESHPSPLNPAMK